MKTKVDGGLRAIALMEGIKGVLAVAIGCGILALQGRDFEGLALSWLLKLGVDPAARWSAAALEAGAELNESRIGLVGGLVLAYSATRLIESYGLWRGRRWAEWFSALSGGIYIPLEIYEIARGVSLFKVGTLLVNVAVVAYLVARLRRPKSLAPSPYL
ncbi:MAG: DUF2127 domain-containing protein [Verrucomicrobia bacterium]|nr:DUF2127 domain-containing protein [Verrucomicrobiota bacterium]